MPAKVAGSPGCGVVENRSEKPRRPECRAQSDHQADPGQDRPASQDEGQDIAPARAESHANADFAGAPGDLPGDERVRPDDREQQRNRAEGGEDAAGEPLAHGRESHPLLHRADLEDGKRRVESVNDLADARCHGRWRHSGLHVDNCVWTWGLEVRDEHVGSRRVVGVAEPHVADHPDDFGAIVEAALSHGHDVPDRAFVGPELLRRRLVHHDHLRAAADIGRW